MDSPGHQDVSHTTAFKNLQFQFVNWAASWTHRGDQTQHIALSLSDTVNLLQTLGFKIRHFDVCAPEDTTALEHGDKGIRLIASCNHSGQRFYLEKPVPKDNCQCKQVIHDGTSKDIKWEIATSRPSVDQDSLVKDVIPSLSDEMRQITYSVVNYLLHMMHGSVKTNTALTSATPLPVPTESALVTRFEMYKEPSCVAKVSSLQNDFMAIPGITVSSPRDTTSSDRYRSLDTLMSREGNVDLPAPRPLVSEDLSESSGVVHSSENVAHLSRSDIPSDIDRLDINRNGNDFRKAVLLLKRAYRNLFNGISLIEMNCMDASFDSVFEQSTNTIESIERLVSSAPKSPPTTIASGLDLSTSTPNKGQSQLNSDIGEESMSSKSAMGVEAAVKTVSAGNSPDTTAASLQTEEHTKRNQGIFVKPVLTRAGSNPSISTKQLPSKQELQKESWKTYKGSTKSAVVRAVSSPNLQRMPNCETEQANQKTQLKKETVKPTCKSTKSATKLSAFGVTKISTAVKALSVKKKALTKTTTHTKSSISGVSALMTRAASSPDLKSTIRVTQQPQLAQKHRRVSLFPSNSNLTKNIDKPLSDTVSTCGLRSNVKKSHSFKVLRGDRKDEKDTTTSKIAKSTITKASSSPSILKSATVTTKRPQLKLNYQKVPADGPSVNKASTSSSSKITKN